MRELNNLSQDDAKKNGWKVLKDLGCEVIGKAIYDDGDIQIMKSTKRFKVPGGWLYNTSTEIHGVDSGEMTVAEALAFVPERQNA